MVGWWAGMLGWLDGGMVMGWWNGGMVEWWDGGLVGWLDGMVGMVGWSVGGGIMEEYSPPLDQMSRGEGDKSLC